MGTVVAQRLESTCISKKRYAAGMRLSLRHWSYVQSLKTRMEHVRGGRKAPTESSPGQQTFKADHRACASH
jgi:hypothetical protein